MVDVSKIISVNVNNINKFINIITTNVSTIMLHTISALYIPPLGDAVNFVFGEGTYTPPNGDAVNMIL